MGRLKEVRPNGPRRRDTQVNCCWVCAPGLSEPLAHCTLFCGQSQTPSWSLLGKYVIFAIPPQSLSIYIYLPHIVCILYEEHFTFHLQYKHSGTFANLKYEDLQSYPKNEKMFDPILVPLLKTRPHYSQSSRENTTPSSGTIPIIIVILIIVNRLNYQYPIVNCTVYSVFNCQKC